MRSRSDTMPKSNRKSTTIRDVASTAGVSVGTVSRSINVPESVRPGTFAKVDAAIRSLGFHPDSRERRGTMVPGDYLK